MILRSNECCKTIDQVSFYYWAIAEMSDTELPGFRMWLMFGQVVGES